MVNLTVWSVQVNIEEHEVFRPSEIIADLRAAAEALYYPFKVVGFWDSHADMHLCPWEQRREECPHRLDSGNSGYVEYEETVSRQMGATLRVEFPHAKVRLYLR